MYANIFISIRNVYILFIIDIIISVVHDASGWTLVLQQQSFEFKNRIAGITDIPIYFHLYSKSIDNFYLSILSQLEKGDYEIIFQ